MQLLSHALATTFALPRPIPHEAKNNPPPHRSWRCNSTRGGCGRGATGGARWRWCWWRWHDARWVPCLSHCVSLCVSLMVLNDVLNGRDRLPLTTSVSAHRRRCHMASSCASPRYAWCECLHAPCSGARLSHAPRDGASDVTLGCVGVWLRSRAAAARAGGGRAGRVACPPRSRFVRWRLGSWPTTHATRCVRRRRGFKCWFVGSRNTRLPLLRQPPMGGVCTGQRTGAHGGGPTAGQHHRYTTDLSLLRGNPPVRLPTKLSMYLVYQGRRTGTFRCGRTCWV